MILIILKTEKKKYKNILKAYSIKTNYYIFQIFIRMKVTLFNYKSMIVNSILIFLFLFLLLLNTIQKN